MKKTVKLLIIFTLLALLIPSTALANGDPVYLFPIWFDEATAYPDQELILFTGWGACTKGLIRSFLTSAHLTWWLDGELVVESYHKTNNYWSPIMEDDPMGACISGHNTQAWLTYYAYPMGTLEPGDYQLDLLYCFDHPVNDGYDGKDGIYDGKPDKYFGCKEHSMIVHVLPFP